MKLHVITILLVFLSSHLMAQTDNEIVSHIEKGAKNMTTLQCDFVQKKQISMLNEVITSTGHLYYARENKLCWEYQKPYFYKFIMNADKVMLKSGSSVNVFDTKSNKFFSQISKLIISGVDGSGITDKERFEISFLANDNEVIVTLVPKARDIKKMFSTVKLHFDNKTYFVEEIEMIEPSGDNTSIRLTNRIMNKPIDEKIFIIE